MKSKILLLMMLLTSIARAENVTCTLQSGQKKATTTIAFSEIEDGYLYAYNEEGVFDLTFSLEGECTDKKCEAWATIDSQIVEDEVGQLDFEFIRSKENAGRVFSEKLTDAPDSRDYIFYCYYNR